MVDAQPSAPDLQPASIEAGERRCLATGETLIKDQMVRFVVGPSDQIVPDLAQNLPGRGLWVKADDAAITLAATKGLFAKAAKAPVKAAADLADQVKKLLRARCLNFVGLAKGAGIAVLGQPQVEKELRAGKLALLLLADDAKSELDQRHKVSEYHLFTRDELGAALGFAQIVYAGFKPHGLTRSLRAEIQRLTQLTQTSPIDTSPTDNGMDTRAL